MTFLTFPKELTEKLKKKCSISATNWTKLVTYGYGWTSRMPLGFVWLALPTNVTCKVLWWGQRGWIKLPKSAQNSQDVKEQSMERLDVSLFKTSPDILKVKSTTVYCQANHSISPTHCINVNIIICIFADAHFVNLSFLWLDVKVDRQKT